MQKMDLDNAMKYQKTKSNYMEFSRNCGHEINKDNRPKIWPSKLTMAGQIRLDLEAFCWFLHTRKVGFKRFVQV